MESPSPVPFPMGLVVKNGRNTFLSEHRQARDNILDYLDEQRIWDQDGNRLTKDALTAAEDLKAWAKYETLVIIAEGNSNAIDDIFGDKARRWSVKRDESRSRGALRLDRDGDDITDEVKLDNRTSALIRR